MHLKQISRIVVRFSPWTGEARSAREFLARVTSAPARASNPDCKVDTKIRCEDMREHHLALTSSPVEQVQLVYSPPGAGSSAG